MAEQTFKLLGQELCDQGIAVHPVEQRQQFLHEGGNGLCFWRCRYALGKIHQLGFAHLVRRREGLALNGTSNYLLNLRQGTRL